MKIRQHASRLIALTAALLGLNVASCLAATYYVNATSGLDSAAGTSPATAWKTLAKVNGSTFAPGDSILLARGEIWREQLTVPSSGASGQPITFGAYGGGNQPAIVGSTLVTGWTSLGSSTYRSSYLSTPKNLYVDDNGAQSIALTIKTSAAAVTANPGSWYYDTTAKQITVRLADSSDPETHAMAVPVRFNGILSSNHSFVTVQDITVRQTSKTGINFTNTVLPTGTLATNYDNNFNEHITVQGCIVYSCGGEAGPQDGGIYCSSTPYLATTIKPMLRGWRVLNNLVGRVEDSLKNDDYDRGGIEIRGTTGALISGNTVTAGVKYAISIREDTRWSGSVNEITPSSSPTVTNNNVSQSHTNISVAYSDNAAITNNRIHDSSGYGIGIGGSNNALVAYNIIYNLTSSPVIPVVPPAVPHPSNYNGIDINNASLNGRAYHNSIRQVSSACITVEGDSGHPSNGWLIKNNIFDGSTNPEDIGNQHSEVYIASGVTLPTFAKNIYVDSAAHLNKAIQNPSGSYHDSTWYQTNTGDTTSTFTTTSQFVAPDDLRLASGSVAAGNAVVLTDITQLSLDIGAIPGGTPQNPLSLRNPENPANTVNGIDYKYYEGSWTSLPNYDSLTPVKADVLTNFSLTPKNIADNFGFTYTGFVDVPMDGFYTFYTNSDGGSKFTIGNIEVVSNDGQHTATEKQGTIGLKAGKHAFKVVYFDATGSETLEVRWAGPGLSKQLIPDSQLYRNPLNAGLVGWWKLDESSGTSAADSSGFNKTGTTFSTTWNPVSGKIGGSASFSGSSTRIELPDSTIKNASSALSFACWFKTSSSGDIVGVNNAHYPTTPTNWGPMLYVGSNGKLLGKIWDGNSTFIMSSGTVNDGAWHHAALVASGVNQYLYLDGTLVGSLTGNNFSIGPNVINQLGVGYTSGWWYGNNRWMLYSGQLDDVRLYKRMLTVSEVGILAAG